MHPLLIPSLVNNINTSHNFLEGPQHWIVQSDRSNSKTAKSSLASQAQNVIFFRLHVISCIDGNVKSQKNCRLPFVRYKQFGKFSTTKIVRICLIENLDALDCGNKKIFSVYHLENSCPCQSSKFLRKQLRVSHICGSENRICFLARFFTC